MSFVKRIVVSDALSGNIEAEVNMLDIDDFQGRLDCINSLPSMVMFDEDNGVFSKVTGYFINRLENCFHQEKCP